MKQKKESKPNSAAYKSRTGPTQYIVVVNFDGSEPKEESIEHDGIIYNRTDRIVFDLESVPDHVKNRLAATTLECYRNFLKKPGAAEWLDERIRKRKGGEN